MTKFKYYKSENDLPLFLVMSLTFFYLQSVNYTSAVILKTEPCKLAARLFFTRIFTATMLADLS